VTGVQTGDLPIWYMPLAEKLIRRRYHALDYE
jgi:hypothetical protein